MNCILPWARARPVGMLMLLLILVHRTTSASASNVALQRLEEDKDGNVAKAKESQLRKKPRLVKAEEDLNPNLQSRVYPPYNEYEYEYFFEAEQMKMTERNLSIFDADGTDEDEDERTCLDEDGEIRDECRPDYVPPEDDYESPDPEANFAYDYKDDPDHYSDISYSFAEVEDDYEEVGCLGSDKKGASSKQAKQSPSSSGGDNFVVSPSTTTVLTQTDLARALSNLEEADHFLRNAHNLRALERGRSREVIAALKIVFEAEAIAMPDGSRSISVQEQGSISKDEFKAVSDFCGQLAGLGNDLNSDDENTQFRASMRLASQFALTIGNKIPPAGFILSSVFSLAGLLNPFPTPEGIPLSRKLEDAITAGLNRFHDQLLTDELNQVRAGMRAQERALDRYTGMEVSDQSDSLIVAARNDIFNLLNDNDDRAYRFMEALGDNIDYYDHQQPDVMANRIVSLLQMGRQRIKNCQRRASIFSRLTNDEDPLQAELAFEASTFWNEVEVNATKDSLRRFLVPLMNPPSRTELGIAPVLQSWHTVQSHSQRENLEDFMENDLGMKMPGKVLMIRNLSHNRYMEASRGSCPRNRNWPAAPGFNTDGRDCPWLETTPLSAGQDTSSRKIFRVYGNRARFTLWNIHVKAYIRMQTNFMPTYNRNGRALGFYDFNRFSSYPHWMTSRLPLLHQIEPQPILRENVRNEPQWQYYNWPQYDRDGWPVHRIMIGAPSHCNEFVVGPRRSVQDVGVGDSLFARCAWGASFAGTVEWTLYSTNWATGDRNGNGRNRHQVLLWTQQNRQCCAREGRSDTVTQGVWGFELLSSSEALHGAAYRLPIRGQL